MDVNIDTAVIQSASDDAPNSRSWKIFADAINHAWRRSAWEFVECGRLLAEAKEELSPDDYAAMNSKLDFNSSVARKLMRIAANEIICAFVHKFPPCWSTLYELSQVPKDVLTAALADGRIHPGMMKKHAVALRPPKRTPVKTKSAPTALGVVWKAASREERQTFLTGLGRAGLCGAMSPAFLAELRDHLINLNVAGASKSSAFATYATDKLHMALRCAEQRGRHQAHGGGVGSHR